MIAQRIPVESSATFCRSPLSTYSHEIARMDSKGREARMAANNEYLFPSSDTAATMRPEITIFIQNIARSLIKFEHQSHSL